MLFKLHDFIVLLFMNPENSLPAVDKGVCFTAG